MNHPKYRQLNFITDVLIDQGFMLNPVIGRWYNLLEMKARKPASVERGCQPVGKQAGGMFYISHFHYCV